MQRMYDEYLRDEVVPFIQHHCHGWQPIATMGASLGAYYAANALFKHPDVFKRCFALSGVYDMKSFMDGMYDDNFYFNNPADYLANLSDPWYYDQLRSCDIHIVTGTGPWEKPGPSYHLSSILSAKGIGHSLDDWGSLGGHDWPYWKHQMREYVRKLY
jgi:esterase/lipase superfamily enzyme